MVLRRNGTYGADIFVARLDPADGSPLWAIADSISSTAADYLDGIDVANGTVYFAAGTLEMGAQTQSLFGAIRASDGSVVALDRGGATSSVNAAGLAVAATSGGDIFGLGTFGQDVNVTTGFVSNTSTTDTNMLNAFLVRYRKDLVPLNLP